ncbi:MAG TPA: hypothetical protein VI006_21525, partial [Solirubrobacteraceae bacterium]
NCTPARGVYDVNEAKLTANGRYLYTYGLDGLAVFRRDRRTGRLTQLRYVGARIAAFTPDPCVQEDRGAVRHAEPATVPGSTR